MPRVHPERENKHEDSGDSRLWTVIRDAEQGRAQEGNPGKTASLDFVGLKSAAICFLKSPKKRKFSSVNGMAF